jgi:DUF177 domain-containing protein
MNPAEFSFPVSDLDAGGKHFRLPIRAAWLRGLLEGTTVGASDRDGELDVRLSRSGNDVVVRGTLAADVVVPCSRCLDPAVILVHEEVSVLAVPSPSAPHGRSDRGRVDERGAGDEEVGEDSGEADVIAYDGDTVVLDELVRDELLLGIPMIPLCSEACPGIRPERAPSSDAAGSPDDAIDPRLRPLLRLKNKK